MSPVELEALRPYCSPNQLRTLEALLEHGSYREAAVALGVAQATARQCIKLLQRKAARQGFDPAHDLTHPVPDGFSVNAMTTQYGSDGKITQQWIKAKKEDEDRLRLVLEACEGLAERIGGKSEYVPPPEPADEDLLSIYPMGDPHIGMYAWANETADRNFDLDIAERNQLAAVRHLVDLAPPSDTAIMLSLGDFFHADSGSNTTTKGTAQDVDGRIAKVLRVGLRIMVKSIEAALRKHQYVRVYCLLGNHDDFTSVVLAVALEAFFNNNQRVIVQTDPKQHHFYEFGVNLLGMHHGHATKASALPGVMACDMSEAWGRTKHRHFYCGHVHHDSVKEYPGVIVETFRTLAPKDAWHAGQGWRSGNDMKVDVWHRRWGHINRHTVGIAKILDTTGKSE